MHAASSGTHTEPNPTPAWLREAARRGASDLHLIGGYPPVLRRHGRLEELSEVTVTDEQVRDWLMDLLPAHLHARFVAERNADFAIELELDGQPQRFRANYFVAAEATGACFRVIPDTIPDFHWAGFPHDLAERLIGFRNGLVLFSGITGAGKTTTLAMIIKLLCEQGDYRVVTIEEPIEYRYPRTSGSIVTQREVGRDVGSFHEGLKYALRQDPDVILVGEIRDRETAQTALSAAETGHLVFATLHTRDAKGAISRYADLFPQDTQHEVRAQLSNSLQAVIGQHLLPSILPDDKRVLALEVLINNSPISIAIRSGRMETIDNTIQTSRAEGMITFDESIRRHYQAGRISRETAEHFVSDRGFLRP